MHGNVEEFCEDGYDRDYYVRSPKKDPIGNPMSTSHIVRGKGRFGIYFVEPGANQRGSKVLYDRENSSIALAKPGDTVRQARPDDVAWWSLIERAAPPEPEPVDRGQSAGRARRIDRVAVEHHLDFVLDGPQCRGGTGRIAIKAAAGNR